MADLILKQDSRPSHVSDNPYGNEALGAPTASTHLMLSILARARVYGHTKSGEPINAELIEVYVEEAERGYTAAQLVGHPRGSRHPDAHRGRVVE